MYRGTVHVQRLKICGCNVRNTHDSFEWPRSQLSLVCFINLSAIFGLCVTICHFSWALNFSDECLLYLIVLPIGYPHCLCTDSQWCVFVFHVQLFSILLFTFTNNIYNFKNSPILSMLRICSVGKGCQYMLFVHTLHLNQYIFSLNQNIFSCPFCLLIEV